MAHASHLANEYVAPEVLKEQRLFAAIIWQAVEDALRPVSPMEKTETGICRRKARTFLTGDSKWFRQLCEYAGIDPDAARARFDKLKRQRWTGIETASNSGRLPPHVLKYRHSQTAPGPATSSTA